MVGLRSAEEAVYTVRSGSYKHLSGAIYCRGRCEMDEGGHGGKEQTDKQTLMTLSRGKGGGRVMEDKKGRKTEDEQSQERWWLNVEKLVLPCPFPSLPFLWRETNRAGRTLSETSS